MAKKDEKDEKQKEPSGPTDEVPGVLVGLTRTNQASALVAPDTEAERIQKLLFYGDISSFSIQQQNEYLFLLAKSMGINPWAKPFDFILNDKGRLIVYANKGAAAQFRETRHITLAKIYAGPLRMGNKVDETVYEVEMEGSMPDPLAEGGFRRGNGVGLVAFGELTGTARANAVMKCHTKAERRLTLALAGVGFADESETDDFARRDQTPAPQRRTPPQRAGLNPAPIPFQAPAPDAPTVVVEGEVVDKKTGEILEVQKAAPPPPPVQPQTPLPPISKYPPAVAPVTRK